MEAGEVIGTGGSAYPTLAATTITPSSSSQTVGANGTYMLGAVTVSAVPAGAVALPTALASSGGATVTSNGTEITLNKSMSIIASVTTPGYVDSIPTSTADVTLRATDANFLAENIKSGVTLFGKAGSYTGGGGGWTKIGSTTELAVSNTSTSASAAGSVSLGSSVWDKGKILYVRIRDKEGARNGYFYGTDNFFMNWRNANGQTNSDLTVAAQEYYRYNNSAYVGVTGAYGVYAYSLTRDGTLNIRKRYNSTSTLTINSTYTIDVYTIDPPLTLF